MIQQRISVTDLPRLLKWEKLGLLTKAEIGLCHPPGLLFKPAINSYRYPATIKWLITTSVGAYIYGKKKDLGIKPKKLFPFPY
jgi:hypothetical protein